MAEKPTSSQPATGQQSQQPRVAAVKGQNIQLEFQIDDLIRRLLPVQAAGHCGGCNGCGGCSHFA